MLALALAFALNGLVPAVPDGLPVAPVDLDAGVQAIELREPLMARGSGARLVLLVRDRAATAADPARTVAAFEERLPTGSVEARLRGTNGVALTLKHTGYVYHRGYAGLVLTGQGGVKNRRYDHLEIESSRTLENVRMVWLDRTGRQLQDLPF